MVRSLAGAAQRDAVSAVLSPADGTGQQTAGGIQVVGDNRTSGVDGAQVLIGAQSAPEQGHVSSQLVAVDEVAVGPPHGQVEGGLGQIPVGVEGEGP